MMKLYVEPDDDDAGYKAWHNFRLHYKIFYTEWDHDYVAGKLAEYGAEAKVWGTRDYPHIKFPSEEMATFFLLKWS
jgi:hypothetical protein